MWRLSTAGPRLTVHPRVYGDVVFPHCINDSAGMSSVIYALAGRGINTDFDDKSHPPSLGRVEPKRGEGLPGVLADLVSRDCRNALPLVPRDPPVKTGG